MMRPPELDSPAGKNRSAAILFETPAGRAMRRIGTIRRIALAFRGGRGYSSPSGDLVGPPETPNLFATPRLICPGAVALSLSSQAASPDRPIGVAASRGAVRPR